MEEYTDQLEADYLEEKMKTEQLLYQLLPRYRVYRSASSWLFKGKYDNKEFKFIITISFFVGNPVEVS